MADYPDVFADGWAISAGPYGITLTLRQSDPPTEVPTGRGPAPSIKAQPDIVVARVRMSHAFAVALADSIKGVVKQAESQPQGQVSKTSH